MAGIGIDRNVSQARFNFRRYTIPLFRCSAMARSALMWVLVQQCCTSGCPWAGSSWTKSTWERSPGGRQSATGSGNSSSAMGAANVLHVSRASYFQDRHHGGVVSRRDESRNEFCSNTIDSGRVGRQVCWRNENNNVAKRSMYWLHRLL
jgi:hypothetical protein